MPERRRGTYAELAFLSRAGRYTLIESLSADLERITELVAKYDDLPLRALLPPAPGRLPAAAAR